MRKKYLLFFIISFGIILSSCDTKEEKIPSFISVDTVEVIINDPAKEGSNTHKITDIWVYIDNKYQGIYQPPRSFPVLETGNHLVTFRAGITKNGISATREEYPFYNYFELDTNLIPDQEIKITPKFTYIDNCHIWKEDFEDPNFKIGSNPQLPSDTSMVRIEDPDHQGNYIGAAYTDAVNSKFIASTNKTTDPIYYQDAERRIFLELDYKCNTHFYVGLLGDDLITVILINTSNKWNKIYVDLTPSIKSNPANVYALAFWMFYDGEKQCNLFIDNVKIVRYE